jgi:hypothetical protein
MCLEFTGELSELMRAATQTARDSADRDDRFTIGLLSQALPLTQLMQDDPRAAHAYISAQSRKLDGDFSWLHFTLLEREVDVLLYEGKGREAFERVRSQWDPLSIHLRRSGRLARACTLLMRARAGLAAEAELPDAATLATVTADSHELRQLGAGFAGFGPVIDAQLACLRGDRGAARVHFEDAIRSFSHEQSDHVLKYVRYRLGELVGDVVGQTSCRDIRAWLEQQGVVNAEHFIRIFVPVGIVARN